MRFLPSLVLTVLLLLGLDARPVLAAVDRSAAAMAAAALEAGARADGDALLRDVYAARRFAPLWAGQPDAVTRRGVMLALLARERRLAGSGVAAEQLGRAFDKAQGRAQAEAELALTRAALAYLGRRSGGRAVRAPTALQLLVEPAAARSGADLSLALHELRIVEALGGWRPVRLRPAPSVIIPPLVPVRPELELVPPLAERPRQQPEVADLRARLAQSLDLPPAHLAGETIDGPLEAAVKRFQDRHGLLPDGVVGARTATALNQRAAAQVRQVELNLARKQTAGREGLPRYIEVNIPGFELRLTEGGRVTHRARVIVGDQDTPTPIFDDRMRYVEVNPAWNVPRSIVSEVLDKEAKEPGYMSKAGFVWRAGGGEGASARLVQRPGPENALGRLKFVFPNHHAVYIHDTPNRGLFSRNDRTLSHGCIRVEDPAALAIALLGRQGWDRARLDGAFAVPGTRRVMLDAPVPVFLDYRTAGVDPDGRLQLWPDIYGFDAAGVTHFATKGLPPDPPPAPRVLPVPSAPPIPAELPPTVSAGLAPTPLLPPTVAGTIVATPAPIESAAAPVPATALPVTVLPTAAPPPASVPTVTGTLPAATVSPPATIPTATGS